MNSDQDNLDWCYDMLSEVSRTFEIPIKELGSPSGDYICVGYLLCRIADTVEDTPYLSGDKKHEVLQEYREAIDQNEETTVKEFEQTIASIRPSDPLEKEYWNLAEDTSIAMDVLSDFPEDVQQSILKYVDELTYGMAKFMSKHDGFVRIEDQEELEEYCYYVAGTVGHMLAETDVDNPSKEFHQMAENYGLLLQTVNVSKDVYGDYNEEDNIYIPSEFLEEKGVEQDNLLDEENVEATADAVSDVMEYSRSKVPSARNYLKSIAEQSGLRHMRTWTMPYLLAVATLRELEENAKQSLTEGGVKITRNEVANIISESKDLQPDELKEMEKRIDQGELK